MQRFIVMVILVGLMMTGASRVSAEEQVYFVHSDQLGSTSLTTNDQGEIINNQAYYPFGSTRSRHPELVSGSEITERQYTGQVSDTDQTGLYYYNARYYNPLVAKFTQADTIEDGQNSYAYVSNNPVIYSDPTGHCKGIGCWLEDLWDEIGEGWRDLNQANIDLAKSNIEDPDVVQMNITAGLVGVYFLSMTADVATNGVYRFTDTVDLAACAVNPDPSCTLNALEFGPNMSAVDDTVESLARTSDEMVDVTHRSNVGGVRMVSDDALEETRRFLGGNEGASGRIYDIEPGKVAKVIRSDLPNMSEQLPYYQREYGRAQRMADLGVGPQVYDWIETPSGRFGYVMEDLAPGNFVDMVPENVNRTTFPSLKRNANTLRRAGFAVGDFQYFVMPDGSTMFIDAGGMGSYDDAGVSMMNALKRSKKAIKSSR